ncbi:MAG: dockerin type I repeat-containing protein, partial [Erysipelotrichaceae bacterium]
PFIILEKVTGELVNGSDVWYKIQSDPILNSDRSAMILERDEKYNFSNNYAYVHSSYVTYLGDGKCKPENPPVEIKRGDVNQNNTIDAADYLMVMDSIVGKYNMSDIQKTIGDVNKNGSIDAADYLMIMDSIIGKIKL